MWTIREKHKLHKHKSSSIYTARYNKYGAAPHGVAHSVRHGDGAS